jgi:hypothetical protein
MMIVAQGVTQGKQRNIVIQLLSYQIDPPLGKLIRREQQVHTGGDSNFVLLIGHFVILFRQGNLFLRQFDSTMAVFHLQYPPLHFLAHIELQLGDIIVRDADVRVGQSEVGDARAVEEAPTCAENNPPYPVAVGKTDRGVPIPGKRRVELG